MGIWDVLLSGRRAGAQLWQRWSRGRWKSTSEGAASGQALQQEAGGGKQSETFRVVQSRPARQRLRTP